MTKDEPGLTLKVHQVLEEDLVLLELQSQKREDVLEELARFIKDRRVEFADQDLYEKLLKRERLGSTAVGDGYAIPHCKIQGIDTALISLAISRKGIIFDSADGNPSFIFFTVVTPAERPSLNLQLLAVVAHLIRRSRHLSRKLRRARSKREILALIREEEEKIS